MERRSLRLQQAGYYLGNGTPVCSYKEVLHSDTPRRRIKRRRNPVDTGIKATENEMEEQGDSMGCHIEQSEPPATLITLKNIMFVISVLLVILIFMVFSVFMKAMANEKRVESVATRTDELLQRMNSVGGQMNMFVALADTFFDLPLEPRAARVLQHLSSDRYLSSDPPSLWERLSYRWTNAAAQQRVIQKRYLLLPKHCWCFSGNRGHLVVELSDPAIITHMIIGHISKLQFPDIDTTSAPREFSIYGMRTTDDKGTFLGKMAYDIEGTPFQTFRLPV